jgi:hypothetical protein
MKALPSAMVFICCAVAAAQNQDWQSAIQHRLESQYALTQASPDNSTIIRQGASVTIGKPNLVILSIDTPNVIPNVYKDGKITQSLFGSFNRLPGMSQNKTLAPGGQMFVTGIEIRKDSVIFSLLSDASGGTRYKATLRFPWSRGSAPTPDQVSAMVAEVLQPAGSSASPGQVAPSGGMSAGGSNSSAAEAMDSSTPASLDVVGLRLGMTVEEAKAQLQKYRPDLLIATTYATENSAYWKDGNGIVPQDHELYYNARVRVPIGIIAGHIDKIYKKENPYSSDTKLTLLASEDAPFAQFSGEFFRLKFTPNDSGGRLYSIVREKIYAFDAGMPLVRYADAGLALPSIDELDQGIVAKYGEPADKGKGPFVGAAVNEPLNGVGWKNQNTAWAATGSIWMYDRSSQPVSLRSRDFNRCASHFEFPFKRAAFYSAMKPGGMTLNEIQNAFGDKDFSSPQYQRHAGRTDPAEVVHDFAEEFDLTTTTRSGYGNYGGCGTQLQVVILPTVMAGHPTKYAGAMIVSLTDQDAAFSDNGVAAYMKPLADKALNVAPPPAKKETF